MKRVEPESLGDILRQAIQEEGLSQRLLETRAEALWPHIVGKDIAQLTSRPYVVNGVMYLYVKQAPLRQELHMTRSRLVKIINETLGKEVIKDIKFKI